MDPRNMLSEGTRRTRRPTKTYWDQYVIENDPTVRGFDPERKTLAWLISDKGYFNDVPPEEMDAAIHGSDWSNSDEEEEDDEYGNDDESESESDDSEESEESLHV